MKKQNSANSIRYLFFFMLFILIIFAATLSFANVNCVIETAYAEELSETQILPNMSIGKGIQINALDHESYITLEADSDNWFNYNCVTGGAYGFKINYTNADMRDYLDFYVESANGEVLESTKKILPAITTGQRKSIVYHITLKAGTTYNFNIKFSNAGFDYLDTGLIISQWNQYEKVTLNNDKIIDNRSSQNIYHLVAGQTYVINFTYLNFSSGANIPNILYYDNSMKEMVYKNDKSITENDYGENRDTVNGDKITAKTDKIGQIGTIYFVDHVQIYSVKFEIVDKPYTVSPVFDHVNFKLSLSFMDSYGKAVSTENLSKIISNASLIFENDGGQYPINNFVIDMNDLPFWREEENLSVIVNYAIPWYGNENYQYTETYSSIKVETPILDAKKSSEVSTNKRIKIINLSSNQHIKISGIVEAVILENFNVNNVTFDINVTHDINVFINNLTLTTNNSSVIKSTASNLNLYLKGSNTIKGKILSNEYLVEALGIKFTGSGSMQIIGYNGANGSNGTTTSVDGSNGENGTNALNCTSYSVISDNVTIKGGDGGNGGNGYNQTEANGLNGGKGGDGGNAGQSGSAGAKGPSGQSGSARIKGTYEYYRFTNEIFGVIG